MKLRFLFLVLAVLSQPAWAKVVRFDIESREDILAGQPFGLAGAYEKIAGKVYLAVDPTIEPNLIITDITKAPTNDEGFVEFGAEFYIVKPKRAERGNGSLLLEVGNRGGKGLLSFFNFGERSYNPESKEHFGDGFLLREGFSLLWVGWQWDTPEIDGRMRMFPPVATEKGKAIRGIVRSDFVPREPESDHSLADRNHIAYPVADPDAPENLLTLRDDVEAERQVVPRSKWGFGRMENGRVVDDLSAKIYRPY